MVCLCCLRWLQRILDILFQVPKLCSYYEHFGNNKRKEKRSSNLFFQSSVMWREKPLLHFGVDTARSSETKGCLNSLLSVVILGLHKMTQQLNLANFVVPSKNLQFCTPCVRNFSSLSICIRCSRLKYLHVSSKLKDNLGVKNGRIF